MAMILVGSHTTSVIDHADTDDIFTVQEIDPAHFVSLFPARLSRHEQIHHTRQEAWQHIAEVMRNDIEP